MNPIKLIIVDDHTLIRETWNIILSSDSRFKVLGVAASAEEGIQLCKEHRPDIVILDINLPGMSGIEAVPLIMKYAPGSRVIGVSLHSQVAYAKKMMQCGAWGYVTKNSHHQEMTQALIEVSQGKKYICEEIRNLIAERLINEDEKEKSLGALSIREIEIIKLIKEGLSSKEIAVAKSISIKTVEVHRYNILKKLQLKNVAALVNFVHEYYLTVN